MKIVIIILSIILNNNINNKNDNRGMNILKSLKEVILSAHFISVDSLISRSFP